MKKHNLVKNLYIGLAVCGTFFLSGCGNSLRMETYQRLKELDKSYETKIDQRKITLDCTRWDYGIQYLSLEIEDLKLHQTKKMMDYWEISIIPPGLSFRGLDKLYINGKFQDPPYDKKYEKEMDEILRSIKPDLERLEK